MKKFIISILALILVFPQNSFAWGRRGHDAVAAIAEANLNPKTKKILENALGGYSIIRYSAWMDDSRMLPAYAYTTKAHIFYVDDDNDYTPLLGSNFAEGEYKADAVCELLNRIEMAKNYKELDDSTLAVTIKMIVHLVGDIHCPSHIYYKDQVHAPYSLKCSYFNPKVNTKYHTIWDDYLFDNVHKWGYMEFVHQLDRLSKKEVAELVKGTPVDWAKENAANCRFIYDVVDLNNAAVNKELAFHTLVPLADSQVQKAGYRLAAVLNSLFK
ncbi:MAG: S1/P1 nuclease [Bacteroidales bacterium]|nr:S1/P1 nuclease [Bacteroidales bacterium]